MSTIITCPECEKQFKGKPELRGKKVRCPRCEHVFVARFPAPRAEEDEAEEAAPVKSRIPAKAAAAPEPSPAPATGAAIIGSNDEDDGRAYGVGVQDLRARCPVCANVMENEDAVVCLFCGYNTQTRQGARTVKTVAKTFGDYMKHLAPAFIALTVIISLIVYLLWCCTVLPYELAGSWFSWLGHESIRMWNVIIFLFVIWGMGLIVHQRLILNPVPPDKIKDDKPKDSKAKGKKK